MKNLFAIIILSSVVTSCINSSSKDSNDTNNIEEVSPKDDIVTQGIIVDVLKICNKSEIEVERILGKPNKVEKVSPSGTPCKEIPCTKSMYKNGQFEIIYINKKSDWITINNVSDIACDSENIKLLGLQPKKPDFDNPGNFIKWNSIENIKEINFFDNGENKIDYIYIKASTN